MRTRGFTLIEALVVIAVIALLIGLLLPALGGARQSSRQLLSLANGRSIGQSFELYHDEYDAYPFNEPYAGSVGGSAMYYRWFPENTIIATTDLFSMAWGWAAMVSEITPWEEAYETWVSPGLPTDLPEPPEPSNANEHRPERAISWRFAAAFQGDPVMWAKNPGDREERFRATRADLVRHPSQKVMLFDAHLGYVRPEPLIEDGHWAHVTPMVFADGHGDAKLPQDATPGVANAHSRRDTRLHHTPTGVHGIDY